MRYFRWLDSLLYITSKTADDIVEKKDKVILPGLEPENFWLIGTHNNDYSKKSRQDQIKFFFDYAELKYH